MKRKARYQIFQDNNLIKEEELIVDCKNGKTVFKDEEAEYSFSSKTFSRKTSDYFFKLNMQKKIAYLELMEYNVIELKVIDLIFVADTDQIKLEYKLESSEEKTTKMVILLGEDIDERKTNRDN